MESTKRHLAGLRDLLVNSFFPEFCVNCGDEGGVLCRWCSMRWTPTPRWEDGVFSLVPYRDPCFRLLLELWKYQGVEHAGQVLKNFMQLSVTNYLASLPDAEAITWVPLHHHKKNIRGFDQAEEIAKALSEVLDLPLVNVLQRAVETEPQAQVDRTARKAADFENVFILSNQQINLNGGHFILVDDVHTTGTTMQAAAKVLLRAGADSVSGFTLARG